MTNVRVGIWDIVDRVAQTVIAGDVGDLWRVEGEIGALLARLDVREFLEFGEYTRRIYHSWGGGSGSWSRLKVSHVRALRFCQPIPATLVGVLSLHGNGYIRAEAIHVLDNVSTKAELRYLLVRLNDWVPVIRESALEAVHKPRAGNRKPGARCAEAVDAAV